MNSLNKSRLLMFLAMCFIALLPLLTFSVTEAKEQSTEVEMVKPSITPFTRILGTVVEKKGGFIVQGATIIFDGKQHYTTDKGLFEFDPILLGRYPITVRARGYQPVTKVVNAVPPLTVVRVELKKILEDSPVGILPPLDHQVAGVDHHTLILNPPEFTKKTPVLAKNIKEIAKPKINQTTNGTPSSKGTEKTPSLVKGAKEVSGRVRFSTARGFAKFTGVITDRESGTPIAGALVEVGPSMVQTDVNGGFLLQDIPADRFNVVFSKKGYHSVAKKIRFETKGTQVKISLQKKE
jgi:hypothetical protein